MRRRDSGTISWKQISGSRKGRGNGSRQKNREIRSANGGTLFLDEIGGLSLAAQAKMLRVLQERTVDRGGSQKPIPIDVRIIAASNEDLNQTIKAETFPRDLY